MDEEFESELYKQPELPKENVAGVWLVIDKDPRMTYLIRADSVNAADSVHTDTHDPHSRGYGGSRFCYRTVDGDLYEVKGPWHSSPSNLYDRTHGEFNVSELHFTRIKLSDEDDNVLYHETEMVLGTFWRGYRAAVQLAKIQNRRIKYDITSAGGGQSGWIDPSDTVVHPHSYRSENR